MSEFLLDNLLVPIHLIIELISWTGLAPWKFEFPVLNDRGPPRRMALAIALMMIWLRRSRAKNHLTNKKHLSRRTLQ